MILPKFDLALYVLLAFAFFLGLSDAATNLMLVLGIIYVFIRALKVPLKMSCPKGIVISLVIFCSSVAIAGVWAENSAESSRAGFALILNILPMFFPLLLLSEKKQVPWAVLALGGSVLLNSAYAFYQIVMKLPVVGYTNEVDFLTTSLLIGIATLVTTFDKFDFSASQQQGLLGISGVAVIVLLLLGNSSTLLGLMVLGLLATAVNYQNKLKVAVSLVVSVMAGAVAVLNFANINLTEKMSLWNEAINVFQNNQIIGIGHSQFNVVLNNLTFTNAQSNVFNFLVEGGIIGLLGFVILFAYILFYFGKKYFQDKDYLLSSTIIISTVTLLVEGIYKYNVYEPMVMRQYWFVLGLIIMLNQLNNKTVDYKTTKTKKSKLKK